MRKRQRTPRSGISPLPVGRGPPGRTRILLISASTATPPPRRGVADRRRKEAGGFFIWVQENSAFPLARGTPRLCDAGHRSRCSVSQQPRQAAFRQTKQYVHFIARIRRASPGWMTPSHHYLVLCYVRCISIKIYIFAIACQLNNTINIPCS